MAILYLNLSLSFIMLDDMARRLEKSQLSQAPSCINLGSIE